MTKLIVPEAILEQHVIALGKTGSGKSSKMRVLAEYALDQGRPATIVDPKGDWWGLKSSADGKKAGYPLVIFGGEHADVPLNPRAGAELGELIATGNRPSLIDLRGWMPGDRTRFFIDFAGALFKHIRGKRWLFIDEVHNFAPKGKVLDPDAGKMLHWANRLASEGRGLGLNIVAASQRPQKVHNDFLTSCETLIACKVIHKADRDAIKDWVDGCADPAVGKQLLADLANMKRTDAWCWSPEIDFGPERITFPMFRTYDSFKPRDHQDAGKLKGWAEVDLDEVKSRLAAVVQEAQANDPAALRKRIAELERQIKAAPAAVPSQEIKAAREAGYDEGYEAGELSGNIEARRSATQYRFRLKEAIVQLLDQTPIADLSPTETGTGSKTHKPALGARPENPVRRVEGRRPADAVTERRTGTAPSLPRARQIDGRAPAGIGASEVDKPMPRAMLTALAQHPDGLTKGQILVHTGYRSSGPVSACFADLARNGWAEATHGGKLRITQPGLDALGAFEPLPVGADLRAFLLNGSKCSTMEKAMLRVLFEAHPDSIAKGKILEATGYASSGPVSAAFARLVALGYANQSGRGELRASEDLFT
jgi:uncharacterized protein